MLSLRRGLTHITRQQMRCSFSQQSSSSVRRLNDRKFSTNYFDDDVLPMGGEQLKEEWPVTKFNTILNTCPHGHRTIIERFGKFHEARDPGLFWAIPFVDKISYVIDMREKALAIQPQSTITKDNVSVDVSGNVYVRFVDAYKGSYGATNPLYATYQHAQASMRAAIGKLEFDEILHARTTINASVSESLQQAAEPWGIECLRYEITEILPAKDMQRAMDQQAVAERDRRELVLSAEGTKRSEVLQSEGVKIRLQNESEGELIKVRNEAEAEKVRLVLTAEGEAIAVVKKSEAESKAIETVAEALSKSNGPEAARLEVARDYILMYGEMGKESNTLMFLPDKPGDPTALFAQAATIFSEVGGNMDRNKLKTSSKKNNTCI